MCDKKKEEVNDGLTWEELFAEEKESKKNNGWVFNLFFVATSLIVVVGCTFLLWGHWSILMVSVLLSFLLCAFWLIHIDGVNGTDAKTIRIKNLFFLVALIGINATLIAWGNEHEPLWGVRAERAAKIKELRNSAANEDANTILQGRKKIRSRLKDPASASFSNEFVSYRIGRPYYCASVNAKNSFGAFSGNKKIISDGRDSGTYLQEQDDNFDRKWIEYCQ